MMRERQRPLEHRLLLSPGVTVGDYVVEAALGVGGMSEVYKARDCKLARDVALKVVGPHCPAGEACAERFMAEARITARFRHPNIVTIFGLGEHEGRPYVALEYVEGPTLRERLNRGALARQEALQIGQSIVKALEGAHCQGVVHRDLKPDNVLLPATGEAKVLDFGIAVLMSEARRVAAERDGEPPPLMGTPKYMAPEQWLQQSANHPATDIWALGVVLHEMLLGRHPYGSHCNAGELAALVADPGPVPLRCHDELPELLSELLKGCLQKRPEDRPNLHEVAGALRAARRRPAFESASPLSLRYPLAVAAAVLVLGFGVYLSRGSNEPIVQALPRLQEPASVAFVRPKPVVPSLAAAAPAAPVEAVVTAPLVVPEITLRAKRRLRRRARPAPSKRDFSPAPESSETRPAPTGVPMKAEDLPQW